MSLSTKRVPPEGPKTARIMVVGEAPGEDEEREGRPFVGKSGQFMERYFGRARVRRSELYLTNISKYRPKNNKFHFVREDSRLPDFLDELKQEIADVDPNVIVAMGAWPMYYLTSLTSPKKNAKPGDGISTWRGSVMPCTLLPSYKVAISYHPAYIIRHEGFKYHPVFMTDIDRAVRNAASKELQYPKYNEYIDPPLDVLEQLANELYGAQWLSIDIETFGPQLACIGFTDSAKRGVCLTFEHGSRNWPVAQQLLLSPARKIFQYGMYDVNYLRWYYGWDTANYYEVGWDTYIAQNIIHPGFSKKLEFLASIYTDFPFYKEDRKTWKQKGSLEVFWKYNLKDVVATFIIAETQRQEMLDLYGSAELPYSEGYKAA